MLLLLTEAGWLMSISRPKNCIPIWWEVILGFIQMMFQGFLISDSTDPQSVVLNGDVDHVHYCGIVNIIYDHYSRMTYGLELDYGAKRLIMNGEANGNQLDINKARDAMRISFGLMFYFKKKSFASICKRCV